MKIYKLLGYLLLGIGAYALLNANNTDLQANSTVTPIRGQAQEQTTYKRNRHTITLVLSQLSDLKVEEGQRVNVGDIISDRTTERTKLQAKKQRLEASLIRARLPLKELKSVPIPKFQSELAALKQAQFNLDTIVQQIYALPISIEREAKTSNVAIRVLREISQCDRGQRKNSSMLHYQTKD